MESTGILSVSGISFNKKGYGSARIMKNRSSEKISLT